MGSTLRFMFAASRLCLRHATPRPLSVCALAVVLGLVQAASGSAFSSVNNITLSAAATARLDGMVEEDFPQDISVDHPAERYYDHTAVADLAIVRTPLITEQALAKAEVSAILDPDQFDLSILTDYTIDTSGTISFASGLVRLAFDIAAPLPVELFVFLEDIAHATGSVKLWRDSALIYEDDLDLPIEPGVFTSTTRTALSFEPGAYELEVYSSSIPFVGSSSPTVLNVVLTAAPEPASAVLLGVMGGAMLRRRPMQ